MPKSNDAAHVVYEFQRSRTEAIRASISTYRGERYADLRTHYLTESDGPDDVWAPTKKGVNVRLDLLPELKRAVDALVAAVGDVAAGERAAT